MENTKKEPNINVEITETWRSIDPRSGEDTIKDFDPEKIVKVDCDPELLEGSEFVLIRAEEIWATDPETGMIYNQITSNGYVRRATEAEDAFIRTQLLTEGVAAQALRAMFV